VDLLVHKLKTEGPDERSIGKKETKKIFRLFLKKRRETKNKGSQPIIQVRVQKGGQKGRRSSRRGSFEQHSVHP
jgi:hypothetical protein